MTFFGELSSNVLHLLTFCLGAVLVYYAIPQRVKKTALLIFSIVFYLFCDWKMFFSIVLVTMFTWYCGSKIGESKGKKWLVAGCTGLILFWIFFKYNSFFAWEMNRMLSAVGMSSRVTSFLMPLGASYYVFKAISYMADIYKGKILAEKNLFTYALYICLFFEVLCGPITRYAVFKESIGKEITYKKENIETGFYLVIKGVFMKAVIANRLAGYVGEVFASPADYSGLTLWLAVFFYTVQLYCDFAGYSFVMIGVTKLFGLHTTLNFNRPYFATNIKDFWNRWHISLSSWLRDYIYIPLGGSRCSKKRAKINVIITFLVSGIWHGTGLNFLVWGLIHGVANCITPKNSNPKGMKKVFMTFLTFCVVAFGWIFFGVDSLHMAFVYLKTMIFNFSFSVEAVQNAMLPFTGDNTSVAFFLTIMFFVLILAIREWYEEKKKISSLQVAGALWQSFLLSSILLFGSFGTSGFIYANF